MSEQQRPQHHYECPGHVGREVIQSTNKEAQGQTHPYHSFVEARTWCPPLISSDLTPTSRSSEAEQLLYKQDSWVLGFLPGPAPPTSPSAPEQIPAPPGDSFPRGTRVGIQLCLRKILAPSSLVVSPRSLPSSPESSPKAGNIL